MVAHGPSCRRRRLAWRARGPRRCVGGAPRRQVPRLLFTALLFLFSVPTCVAALDCAHTAGCALLHGSALACSLIAAAIMASFSAALGFHFMTANLIVDVCTALHARLARACLGVATTAMSTHLGGLAQDTQAQDPETGPQLAGADADACQWAARVHNLTAATSESHWRLGSVSSLVGLLVLIVSLIVAASLVRRVATSTS